MLSLRVVWTREQWQWRGTLLSSKPQDRNLTIRWFNFISRILIGVGSYPSGEMQSVYSTAPANWAGQQKYPTHIDPCDNTLPAYYSKPQLRKTSFNWTIFLVCHNTHHGLKWYLLFVYLPKKTKCDAYFLWEEWALTEAQMRSQFQKCLELHRHSTKKGYLRPQAKTWPCWSRWKPRGRSPAVKGVVSLSHPIRTQSLSSTPM